MRKLCFMLLPLLFLACTDQQPAAPDLADDAVPSILLKSDDGNNGAVVTRGVVGCAVIDGSGAFYPPLTGELLPCGTEVATYSRNGNAKSTVHASGVPNPTGRTVHWGPYNPGWEWAALFSEWFGIDEAPYPCIVLDPEGGLLFTVNWHAVVTPGGNASLSCHYSKNWEYQWP